MGTGRVAFRATRPAGTPVLGSERRHRSASRSARRKVRSRGRSPPSSPSLDAGRPAAGVPRPGRGRQRLALLHRPAVVPGDRQGEPVLGHAPDQDHHRPAGRAGDRGHRRGQPVDGRAAGPALRALRGRPAPGRAGPGRPLPVPAAAAPRHRRLPRAGRRPAGVRPLADLPPLAQPGPLRPARRPVQPRRQLLHVRAAVPAGGVRLAVHHPGPDHPAGRGRPLRPRRDPPPGRDQPHRRPGPVAPVRAPRPDRRPQGLGLLAGQVPAAVLAPRGGRRRLLHRRQGPAASPRGAVLGRPDLRGGVLRGGAAGRAAHPH